MTTTVADVMDDALTATGVKDAQAFRALSPEHDAFWRHLTSLSPIPDPLPPDIDVARQISDEEENELYARLHALPLTARAPVLPEWQPAAGILWPWCNIVCGSFQFVGRDTPRCAITGLDTEPDDNGRTLCVPSLTLQHLRHRRQGK